MNENQDSAFAPPSEREKLDAAWKQLGLVLGFFSRIDTKLSVVLGINLGMLALLATRLPPLNTLAPLLAALLTAFAIAQLLSFWHLWNGSFPHLEGGTNSLVYFRTIASMPESQFVASYSALSHKGLADDLLGQCWRNSKILACKFHSLRRAYLTTCLAVAPWLGMIVLLPAKALAS